MTWERENDSDTSCLKENACIIFGSETLLKRLEVLCHHFVKVISLCRTPQEKNQSLLNNIDPGNEVRLSVIIY